MKRLVLLAALVLAAAPALAAPPVGRYCLHESLGETTGDKLDLIVEVQARGSSIYVILRSAITARTSQVLAIGPLLSAPMPGGNISFTFADGRGGTGEGTMSASGLLSLQPIRMSVVQPDTSLSRNYGAFRVAQDACTDEDKTLKLGR